MMENPIRALNSNRFRQSLGWSAVILSTAASSFWAFWGIIENFHEGWHHASLWRNIAGMFVQYLSFMLSLIAAALASIRWPRLGGCLHFAAAVFTLAFFSGASTRQLIVTPLIYLGLAYWFGRPEPKKWAYGLVTVVPLLVGVVCGVEPALRVACRVDDGDRGARRLTANGADLIWAPEGPGWPDDGVAWSEAVRRCEHLTGDGTSLADQPQNTWRLPTVDEAVRSQCRAGHNSGGRWDIKKGVALYEARPDKESPLWNPHSKVIYWWTATEIDDSNAYIIVYDGKCWPRPKERKQNNLGFRAVRRVDP